MRLGVPEEPGVRSLAQRIELVANTAGIYISSLSFQATPLVGDKVSLSDAGRKGAGQDEQFVLFSFTAEGNQAGLVNFLGQLEGLDRVVTVTNVSFSKPQTTGKGALPLSVSGKATAYYLKGEGQ